ncbi:MAG: hypothetical protein I8H70_04835 [Burkholderiales bacterium]|jgi:hypothetical protein|nr:hypothetical protein [Burkholderiales bacterium]
MELILGGCKDFERWRACASVRLHYPVTPCGLLKANGTGRIDNSSHASCRHVSPFLANGYTGIFLFLGCIAVCLFTRLFL